MTIAEAKLFLNNFYGKEQNKEYAKIALYADVASQVRAMKGFVYADTDATHCVES